MKRTTAEFKVLADYFNTIAAAWFTGGIVSPIFTRATTIEKWIFFIVGITASYGFLLMAMRFARATKI